MDGLFGGYVVAQLVDAAVASSQQRLASHTTTFVSKVDVAPAAITLTTLHSGRTTTLTQLVLEQGGRVRAHARAEVVDGDARPVHVRTTAPASLPEEVLDRGYAPLPFHQLLDVRPIGRPRLSGEGATWVRLRVPPGDVGLASSPGVLAVLMDVPTPGLFGQAPPPVFVPTIDYALHFAPSDSLDLGAWIYLTHSTAWATPSHCVDEAQAWTADGRLLAQVRQTRGVRWT